MMNQEAFVQLIVQKVMERIGKQAWFIPTSEDSDAFTEWVKQEAGDLVRLVDFAEEAEILCLTASSARVFAEVSRGYAEHENAKLILEHLSLGKTVFVLEEGIAYRKYQETCPEKLYEKWLSYENTLKSYGVKFVTKETLFNTVSVQGRQSASVSQKLQSTQGSICHVDQRVVTEKVLSRIPQKNTQTIAIQANAIVTPLAQDYIRQEQLEVQRVPERS
jgi:ethanolamine utilization protein